MVGKQIPYVEKDFQMGADRIKRDWKCFQATGGQKAIKVGVRNCCKLTDKKQKNGEDDPWKGRLKTFTGMVRRGYETRIERKKEKVVAKVLLAALPSTNGTGHGSTTATDDERGRRKITNTILESPRPGRTGGSHTSPMGMGSAQTGPKSMC